MKTTAAEILTAKAAAGSDAFLMVTTLAGDVILWPSEAASVTDDGAKAIGRWQVADEVEDDLLASGEVDQTN